MKVSYLRYLSILVVAMVAVPMAFARNEVPQITQFGHDVRIAVDQKAADVTCMNCSVYVRGQVMGDITALHGNVIVEESGTVAGDVTTVVGDVRADNRTSIRGDVTAVGGRVRREPEATIGGDVTAMQGAAWVYLIMLSPFFVLAGVIALIIWIVRRLNRRSSPVLARAA
ncbi:MAG TPA: polymer-forming cytoskeletal protein [Terriglobales bacterium]|nr:polymer-forming cytoskeletal protein [Terriglobales bacterium]